MGKLFKSVDVDDRLLTPYERMALEDPAFQDADAEEDDALTPEMILAQAREDAARKVQEAYAEGLRRGQEAGRAAFDKSVAQSAAALAATAEVLKEAREAFLASLEPEVVELVGTIAAAVIQREAALDPGIIHATVHRALQALLDREHVVVRLHPDDHQAVHEQKLGLLEEFDGIQRFELQSDESVAPGGCIVDSTLMQVDARLDTQLARILKEMNEAAATLIVEIQEDAPAIEEDEV